MKQGPKVVVIGAGSLFFGRQAIWQMVHSEHLNSGTLALVDVDEAHLSAMAALARKVIDHTGVALKLESGTDAWVINYINPTAANGIGLRICAPNLKTFALCDGLHMPDNAFLEMLCDLSMDGPAPRPVGDAPVGLHGLWQQVLDTHELSARAAVTGDRDLLLRAFACDPMAVSLEDSRNIIEALLEAERDALPEYWFQS